MMNNRRDIIILRAYLTPDMPISIVNETNPETGLEMEKYILVMSRFIDEPIYKGNGVPWAYFKERFALHISLRT